MRQTWRWFGPIDRVTVENALQAGAEGIVSALHHVPTGEVWSLNEIRKRQREARAGGLEWELVESIPVSEAIKTGGAEAVPHIAAWKASLENLARCGIRTVCYNFMPVLDWTRTELRWKTRTGARAMRFDLIDFAAFDLFILKRDGAAATYPDTIRAAAEKRFPELDDEARAALAANIGAGLPGSTERYSLDDLRRLIATYAGVDAEKLRKRLIDFLSEVAPVAEHLDMRLCCHPDDPPWPLLGLPRVMSTQADYEAVLNAVDLPANGVTLCTGSLGARADNDLPGMVERLGPRIHFVHLRNVRREAETVPCSFFEDEHLAGGTDMVAVVVALLKEEERRKREGRSDCVIPFRPDHGQDILDDLTRGAQPGYPAIGRLKGLAEIRGIVRTLEHPQFGM
ncbi:MAG: mannonate dehydratase [Rhizobiaceae bacterium]|nr:MAG: mannonate dehydratase [Rhizobiaceae bacterium]